MNQKNRTARITVGAEVSKHTVSPYLFGNFIEDIDDHMPAMLAYPLRNMDFEEEDADGDGVSGPWRPLGFGKHTRYALEPAARGHGGHSQRIRLFNKDRCAAGIGQAIEAKGDALYRLRIIARATREIAKLRVMLVDPAAGETLASVELELSSHRWQKLGGTLRAARSCARAELQVWAEPLPASEWEDSASTGYVWFDHVSLLPEQETGLLKREVFEMTRELNCGILRLGGNYISLYHWEDFVGPAELRPNYVNEAWEEAGQVHKYFGTDEFVSLCRLLGVEPQICVNMGTGTAEEAAAWVEYCNGDVATPMGALRAANGYPEPYGVRYWEVGNEMYGPWQAGVCTPEQYAESYLEFAEAMKAKDPSILLLGCGTARDSLAPGWNRKVLELAGPAMDFLTLHIYQGRNFFPIDAGTPGPERFRAMTAYSEAAGSLFSEIETLIGERDELKHVKLAVTEWNTMYFPNPDLPNAHTLEAAVANACMLNEMMRRSEIVRIANFSDLVNGWVGGCIRVGDNYERMKRAGWSGREEVVFGTATYHLLRMYAGRRPHRLVETSVECGTFDAGASSLPVRFDGLPKLDVVSCLSEAGDAVIVYIANRSLDGAELICDLSAWTASGTATVRELAGPDCESRNTVFEPEHLREEVRLESLRDGCLATKLSPHSVCVLEIPLDAKLNRIG
ncbi:alpha-L-arabinofuranosidase C-terminal domain-containing protein [Cohnella thailandensis]|uniref:non-reducing end alpha-L-arabinofuranosidase n=1 Tax=Cohnella thailandensis TaxID=557557 RepID=A0A841SRS8_9BACL|nr:alpha-L-arabinofuranosidase C-terminal domain-containing protein [Cohnella thailandensis]MBB6634644.1 alpha-L-arabinofuranosidase [Cohnella thailandensis]MBP1972800.1 alpha-N-arabinofuranosidase [Cohnella thailandensis]